MPDTDVLDRLERTAVRTDDDVVDLVVALLERPVRRQCWVLFLAPRGVPIQLVVPIADLPYQPDDHVDDFGALVADLVEQVDAADVVLAWERPGTRGLSPVDWEWVDAMACVLDEHHVRLRGQVVVHDGGASMVELDDDEVTAAAA
ncbi:hypothetical protein DEJ13_06495 [Curtobacterium sp. MCLR17_007]|uniref:hypothetical protein n=1 Tax=Curtobacterium sp. MCLR17_007 TaxID=2175648 RepID=UPI000DB27546|nr:hypothetical protein [Curtobacterium sp. MCLR17_007]WIB61475.1 hypothetical protein DEJ13_06495 [Curtobacterium sp. MCLR17_007]